MDDVQTSWSTEGMILVMKWISPFAALVWAAVWVVECQTTKPHRPSSSDHSATKTTATETPDKSVGVISGDKTGILVSAEWIDKYKALEAKQHSKIPEDGTIYMEGEQYRIPSKVADHFSDMVRSEPAQTRKPK